MNGNENWNIDELYTYKKPRINLIGKIFITIMIYLLFLGIGYYYTKPYQHQGNESFTVYSLKTFEQKKQIDKLKVYYLDAKEIKNNIKKMDSLLKEMLVLNETNDTNVKLQQQCGDYLENINKQMTFLKGLEIKEEYQQIQKDIVSLYDKEALYLQYCEQSINSLDYDLYQNNAEGYVEEIELLEKQIHENLRVVAESIRINDKDINPPATAQKATTQEGEYETPFDASKSNVKDRIKQTPEQ